MIDAIRVHVRVKRPEVRGLPRGEDWDLGEGPLRSQGNAQQGDRRARTGELQELPSAQA
jgi:hypothetical protein